jgi:hypothetical protein
MRRLRTDAVVQVTSALPVLISSQNSLWEICGRNKWKVTGKGWQRMSMYAKTLDFARGCNSIQIIWLNFLLFFIRDREVGGSNPLAPTNKLLSINYLRS